MQAAIANTRPRTATGIIILLSLFLCASLSVLLPFRLKYVRASINLITAPITIVPILTSSKMLPILYSSIPVSFLTKRKGSKESLAGAADVSSASLNSLAERDILDWQPQRRGVSGPVTAFCSLGKICYICGLIATT